MNQNLIIRKATANDEAAVTAIYLKTHTAEERGETTIGWIRDVYPTQETARAAVERNDLFVMEDNGIAVGTAILNQIQVDVYDGASWKYEADASEVMVMHTLVIAPDMKGRGYGSEFLKFYEVYALENGCPYLRIDTNERNLKARGFYQKHGYEEIEIVPCVFNGIDGVRLVLLEKCLK